MLSAEAEKRVRSLIAEAVSSLAPATPGKDYSQDVKVLQDQITKLQVGVSGLEHFVDELAVKVKNLQGLLAGQQVQPSTIKPEKK